MRAHIQFITCEIVNLHIKCRHRPNNNNMAVRAFLYGFALVLRFDFSAYFSCSPFATAANELMHRSYVYEMTATVCANRSRHIFASTESATVVWRAALTFDSKMRFLVFGARARPSIAKHWNACVDSNYTHAQAQCSRTLCVDNCACGFGGSREYGSNRSRMSRWCPVTARSTARIRIHGCEK